jgi:hypothetical protein
VAIAISQVAAHMLSNGDTTEREGRAKRPRQRIRHFSASRWPPGF